VNSSSSSSPTPDGSTPAAFQDYAEAQATATVRALIAQAARPAQTELEALRVALDLRYQSLTTTLAGAANFDPAPINELVQRLTHAASEEAGAAARAARTVALEEAEARLQQDRAEAQRQLDVMRAEAAAQRDADQRERLALSDAIQKATEQADAMRADRDSQLEALRVAREQGDAVRADRDVQMAALRAATERAEAIQAERDAHLEALRAARERSDAIQADRDAQFEALRIANERAEALQADRDAQLVALHAARERSEVLAVERDAQTEAARIANELAEALRVDRDAQLSAALAAKEEARTVLSEQDALLEAARISNVRHARILEQAQAQVEAARAELAAVQAEAERRLAVGAREIEALRNELERVRTEMELARTEAAQAEAARADAVQAEAARVEAAQMEAARVEAARVEAARAEAARAEAARIEAARVEAEQIEAARIEAARVEAARVEAARAAAQVQAPAVFAVTVPVEAPVVEAPARFETESAILAAVPEQPVFAPAVFEHSVEPVISLVPEPQSQVVPFAEPADTASAFAPVEGYGPDYDEPASAAAEVIAVPEPAPVPSPVELAQPVDPAVVMYQAISGATDLSQVLDALVDGVGTLFPRAALFVVKTKSKRLQGWRSVGFTGGAAITREFELPLTTDSALTRAVTTSRTVFTGNDQAAAGEAWTVTFPVTTGGRVVAVVHADASPRNDETAAPFNREFALDLGHTLVRMAGERIAALTMSARAAFGSVMTGAPVSETPATAVATATPSFNGNGSHGNGTYGTAAAVLQHVPAAAAALGDAGRYASQLVSEINRYSQAAAPAAPVVDQHLQERLADQIEGARGAAAAPPSAPAPAAPASALGLFDEALGKMLGNAASVAVRPV
jgi:hypothetical protein